MFYSNKSSILVSGEGNSYKSKINSFMRILNLQRIVFLMCIVSSGEITWGMEDNKTTWKEKIKVEKLKNDSKEEINLKYNVIFLGDTQVGKTQILNKYVDGSLAIISTIGIDFKSQKYKSTINVDNSQTILLQIYDTAGQEKYRSLLLKYIQDARAIVLVYDITKPESFEHINNWLEDAPKDAVYFLVGNKTDLDDERQVQTEKAKKYADDKNMQFFEVSANNGDNLDELFKNIVKGLLIKYNGIKETISEDGLEDTETNLNTQNTTQTKNKPCICCSCCPCNK